MIRSGAASLALIDENAGPNTSKRLSDACGYHNVALSRLPAGMLGRSIGKPGRMAAAIQKGSLADSLSAALNGLEIKA
jgi:ribosomal protein L7Ae-like RNA K-turn-binding protein